MESGKLISATDTQYSSTLLTSLDDQRNHGLFCDVTVVVEGKKFRAHRNILSASSTFFNQLFSIAGQVVELNFVKAEIFAAILNYVYSSKIVTLRTELLEEFVKSGKILGIKFIADLGISLSQMENITSGAKDNSYKYSCDFDENISKIENTLSEQSEKYGHDAHYLWHVSDQDTVKDCDDGVIYFRDLESPRHLVSNQAEMVPQMTGIDVVELSNEQMSDNSKISLPNVFISEAKYSRNNMLHSVIPHQINYVNSCSPSYTQTSCPPFGTSPDHLISDTILQNQHPLSYSVIPVQQLSSKICLSSIPVISSTESCASQGALTCSSNHQANLEKGSFKIIQNPQISEFTQESSSKPSKQNITFSGSNPLKNEDFSAVMGGGSKYDIDSKRIFSLDKHLEIDELSTVSKSVKNPVEDAHDIVITLKDETVTEVELPKSIDGSLNSGRMKHEDHYQLIDDGKVYYVCNVCKRSYVSLKNLRRHFNIHSLEHKYPCRYCGKVFPLGEYRTKHEATHTGVKRYQCLTCGEAFIYYKSMSTHMKSVHNQDPSLDTKLYRMHSSHSATIQGKTYINSAHPSSDGTIVYDGENEQPNLEEVESCSPSKQMKWDDLFSQHGLLNLKDSPSKANAEIEFVIPEFY